VWLRSRLGVDQRPNPSAYYRAAARLALRIISRIDVGGKGREMLIGDGALEGSAPWEGDVVTGFGSGGGRVKGVSPVWG